jgi:hypothetical protein
MMRCKKYGAFGIALKPLHIHYMNAGKEKGFEVLLTANPLLIWLLDLGSNQGPTD